MAKKAVKRKAGRRTSRKVGTPHAKGGPPGEGTETMGGMMPGMMEGMNPDDMMRMMESMMPSMMERCAESLSGDQMAEAMHEMVPKMMETCFAKMTAEQRASMLSMCRTMLDDLEKGTARPGAPAVAPSSSA